MLIGLASLRPQVGKSECANYLISEYNFKLTEMSDAVIYLSKKYFGYNGNKHDPRQRKILQNIGLMGKQIDPTIWVYYALSWDSEANEQYVGYDALEVLKCNILVDDDYFRNKNLIISGVRSPAEANEIKKIGGQVWLIFRNDKNENESFQHKVENELSEYKKFDRIIENNSSIEDFHKKIDKIMML